MLGDVDAQGLVRQLADEIAEWDTASGLGAKLEYVAATMACHGFGALRPTAAAGGDECAAQANGGDAGFRPVQSRSPDLYRVEAVGHRTTVRQELKILEI